MRVLHRASLGFLLRHPWQLLLALLGITIGVAVIVAVDLANSSARTAFDLSMRTVTGSATHQVIGGPGGLDDSLYVDLRTNHGFTEIAPVIDGRASIDGAELGLLGVDLFAEREFRDYTAAAAGSGAVSRLLTTPGAVLLSADLAGELGLAAGEAFSVRAAGRTHPAEVADVLTGAGDSAPQRLLVVDIGTAQAWLGRPGYLSRIDARLTDAAAVEALRAVLPPGTQLLNAAGRTRSVAELSRAFATNLTAMSLLALLVGVFLIYNSVSFAVLQRRSLIAVLRALGLTRRQTVLLILTEALALGLAGALLGLVAGILLGEELLTLVARSINDLYFRVTVTDLAVQPLSLAKGAAAGIAATLMAALIPALEAASYPPRLAMQRASLEQRSGRLLPRLAMLGLVSAALTLPLLVASGQSLVAGLAALFTLVIGMALCIPWLVWHAARGLAGVAGRAGGALARLAVGGIAASISRTGLAVVALAVAVSATIGVTVMVGSFRLAVTDWLDDTLRSDLYVAAAEGGLAPDAVSRIAAVDGIDEMSSSRRAWIETAQGRTRLVALQMTRRGQQATELVASAGPDAWERFDQEAAVMVSESYAYRHGLLPGDILRLPTGVGVRGFEVAASYRSFDANPAAVIMHRDTYDRFWDDPAVDSVGLWLAPDAQASAVASAVRASMPDVTLEIRSSTALKALSLEIFDRTFVITNVLYWLAVCVAIVGILAAMLALQLERGRELSTLRALGVTRLQLGRMVTLQSTVLGLLSGLAAMPLGIVMAAMLVDVINRRAFGWSMSLHIPAEALWQGLLLATASAALAGLYPAWRAGARMPAHGMRED